LCIEVRAKRGQLSHLRFVKTISSIITVALLAPSSKHLGLVWKLKGTDWLTGDSLDCLHK
jgi:hypothetical protein